MPNLFRWIHLGIWTLAAALPRRIAQVMLALGAAMALAVLLGGTLHERIATGFVRDELQRWPGGPVAVDLAPPAAVLLPGQRVLTSLPPEALNDLEGAGPHWLVLTGTPLPGDGDRALRAEGYRLLDLGFVADLAALVPPLSQIALLALATALLVASRLTGALALAVLGAGLGGLGGWSAVALADLQGLLLAPDAAALLLAGVCASALGALGMRVGMALPEGVEVRLAAALGTLLAAPMLAAAVPQLPEVGLLLGVAALLRPSVLAATLAALPTMAALQPEGSAGLIVLAGCLAAPFVLRAILTPPLRRPRSGATRSEPQPKVSPRGAFDWTTLLEGQKP